RAVPSHLAEHEDDEHAGQRGYVKGTDYALPYFSQWSRLYESESEIRDGLLRHVNCGYLSTRGVPPTLLALKQHAQSLCVLIHALNPTLESAEIAPGGGGDDDDADPLALRYKLNDAFDFLDDLTVPYINDDPDHHKPLAALANEVRARDEALGTTAYHCPLAETRPRGEAGAGGDKPRPYANHHNLVMHANACLERLDHELGSTGGLMSLLPPADTSSGPDPAAAARDSLLGQWLHFTQSLVGRMHELERAYGSALDALAGEAVVPAALALSQYRSQYQYQTGGGRELVYPQDRWVLANAGDDAFERVHALLDRREALAAARERVWRRNGVIGDALWQQRPRRDDGEEDDDDEDDDEEEEEDRGHARGIVTVDILTRYYRLRGAGGAGARSTVFVVPAWEQHPGVEYTREAEARPTVVACAQARFPERATELERRFRDRINRARAVERDNLRLRNRMDELEAEVAVLSRHNDMLAKTRDALILAVG
ncbi:uncharacterized protein P884DRAFT_155882, partial [Thermothelomyces heterothallicus CBS 202.75]|uniref:uncharacterized protein n=1 Tax=Thermothelomyces heterothallicus CBS 202.75 TaxID=1149848 RepID=UPI0037425FB4